MAGYGALLSVAAQVASSQSRRSLPIDHTLFKATLHAFCPEQPHRRTATDTSPWLKIAITNAMAITFSPMADRVPVRHGRNAHHVRQLALSLRMLDGKSLEAVPILETWL